MDGKKAKTLAQKLKENPYSQGSYNMIQNEYNAPQGKGFLQRAFGKIKDWMTPEQQYDPAIVEKMKMDWQEAQGTAVRGEGNWSSNYMDFNDFLKKKYYDYASAAKLGDSVSPMQLGQNY